MKNGQKLNSGFELVPVPPSDNDSNSLLTSNYLKDKAGLLTPAPSPKLTSHSPATLSYSSRALRKKNPITNTEEELAFGYSCEIKPKMPIEPEMLLNLNENQSFSLKKKAIISVERGFERNRSRGLAQKKMVLDDDERSTMSPTSKKQPVRCLEEENYENFLDYDET